jgi:2-polyprenyl-3-methyl-5-hydroxy-6-metoxy-1,4-benzoquinol methylase
MTAPVAESPAFDQARADAFLGKVFGDTVSVAAVAMARMGDQLGLFKDLAAHGPTTSSELAQRTQTQERYAREWLGGMASAGYLDYDASTGQFRLPAEHAPVLADEGGPAFFGGVQEELFGCLAVLDQVTEAFAAGGGVAWADYPEGMFRGIERFTHGWFDNLLLQQWLPALPGVQADLERGIRVADVGCGRGQALIKLATAFPESRFTGYDSHAGSVDAATDTARRSGVDDRVSFRQLDVARGLPTNYDLITTFDVVHDAADPLGMLRSIRQALTPNGTYLCLEINCADNLQDNLGPVGTLFHGFSVLLCMTTSLASGGAGLGTLGLPESRLRTMSGEAGFSGFQRVPFDNPFNTLYELKP